MTEKQDFILGLCLLALLAALLTGIVNFNF
jgi:hypothetical protein